MNHLTRNLPIVVLVFATTVSADEPRVADADAVIVKQLREAGAYVEVSKAGRAVSVWWEVGDEGRFTDAHLKLASKLPQVTEIWLEQTEVTDNGLAALKGMTQLESLTVRCKYETGKPAPITDRGMVHLTQLKNLKVLELDDADVTDAGLVHIAKLKQLKDLDLFGTEISDAGLVHLRGLKNLTYLNISETQWEKKKGAITAKAARALAKHLPNCEIDY